MEKYQRTQQFKVQFCEADFKDELKISTALAYLQEVACYSAEELGFGYEYLQQRNFAFFVSNVYCQFIRPARLGEEIVVSTWPTPPTRVVFGREYRFSTAFGDVLMKATSRWCLIDRATGKLLQSKCLDGQDYSTYNTDKNFEDVQWKIPLFNVEEGEERFSLTVANSECDHYNHVNNTRYADYALNCFTMDELRQNPLHGFGISYLRRAREGDVLRFYRKKAEDGYLVQGINQDGENVVSAKIVFKD
jgi:acyl-ACP thioesterase